MVDRVVRLSARDNPLLARVRRLAGSPAAYRRVGQIWIEGDHLLDAALTAGQTFDTVLLPESREGDARLARLHRDAPRLALVADALWRELCQLDSPPTIAALMNWPGPLPIAPGLPTVVLDRVQDPGNVGSILRSAAALGVRQVVALDGTAALWSPRLMRAAMGAHFALRLVESAAVDDLPGMDLPLLATSSHLGTPLPEALLPQPAAWVFSHEGQGIAAGLASRCAMTVSIPQPGGEESLNVGAAAAICLYESLRQRLTAPR
jgi:TrmH family RNA methyltransferase